MFFSYFRKSTRADESTRAVPRGIVQNIPAIDSSVIGSPFSAYKWSLPTWLHMSSAPVTALIVAVSAGSTVLYLKNSDVASLAALVPSKTMFTSGAPHGAGGPDPEAQLMSVATYHGVRNCAFNPKTKQCDPVSSSSSTASATKPMLSPRARRGSGVALPFNPLRVEVKGTNKIGVYLTSASVARTKFFQETIDKLIAVGGNTVIFDVKGSRVFFKSDVPMANELGLMISSYELQEVMKYLKERNIYVMGRFVAIKDEGLTSRLPETRIRHPKTNQVLTQTWVDPMNAKAIQYNAEVMCELASLGIDEVNLDYIRFSTAEFGALMAYSMEEKADRVEAFIKAMREAIDRCGPATKLGISSYAILGWDYEANVKTLGQDVKRFAQYLDIISPMAYPATFTSDGYYSPAKHGNSRMYWLVKRTLTGYQEMLGPQHAHKLRPWIQGYYVDAKDMTDQMKAVYDAGLCGYTVWNANNNYGPVYTAMKNYQRPVGCLDEPTL